jgi:hypothetical protein
MTEAEIRADEREKCALEVREFANAYVMRWADISGDDHAKATAWNIFQASLALQRTAPSAS